MSKLFFLAVALVVSAFFCESNATAQSFHQGYQFGAGFQSAGMGQCGGGGFYRSMSREQPPYFAQFPPVYYSHVVPRPYGISPYAAPAGIAPVEMSVPVLVPNPVSIKNPHYNGTVTADAGVPQVKPTKEASPAATTGKTTGLKKIVNPHFDRALELVERN